MQNNDTFLVKFSYDITIGKTKNKNKNKPNKQQNKTKTNKSQVIHRCAPYKTPDKNSEKLSEVNFLRRKKHLLTTPQIHNGFH